MKKNIKKDMTLEIFKLLSQKDYSAQEIMSVLNIKHSAFYKCLEKLRLSGFNIEQVQNLYSLGVFKNILYLENEEKNTISTMLNIAKKYLPKEKFKQFYRLIEKFLFLTQEKDYDYVVKYFKLLKRNSFVQELANKINNVDSTSYKKVNIILKSGKKINAAINEIDFSKENLFLCYTNNNTKENKRISIKKIDSITTKNDSLFKARKNEIIFELYDKLAKSYLLKEDERIIEKKKGVLTIASSAKDKKMLFKRLLRYDTLLCKVLYPKDDVKEFKDIIDKTFENMDMEL